MSYILDALRKAEHGRQSAPTPTVPIPTEPVPAAPVDLRRRLLLVLLVAGAAALAVAAVFGWQALRRPVPAAPLAVNPAPAATPRVAETRPLRGEVVDSARPVRREPARALDREALRGREATAPGAPASGPASGPAPAAAATPAPAPRPARGTVTIMGEGPADGRDAAASNLALPATGPAARSAGDVPLYTDLLLNGRLNLPNLRMDMHVFNADPSKRFVFINLRKYREGDRIEDRATVDTITRDGAVLSHNGIRFLLLPD